MITTNISKAKNELSRYLHAVRKGETVLILDRNRPIAQIQPLTEIHHVSSARLDELSAAGLIGRPQTSTKNWPERLQPLGDEHQSYVGSVAALVEERDEGR